MTNARAVLKMKNAHANRDQLGAWASGIPTRLIQRGVIVSAAIRLFTPTDPCDPQVVAGITVREVVSFYRDEKRLQFRSGAYSAARLEKTEFYLYSFCEQFGSLEVSACRNTNLTKWLLGHEEWASPHTKNDAVGAVVGCFRWAVEDRHIDRIPFTRPKKLWPTPQPRHAIEPEEFTVMLEFARRCNGRGRRAAPSRTAFRLALWFLWETGCRTCEMREIEWPMIDWDCGVARLAKHKTDQSGLERVIPLSDRALRLLGWVKRRSGKLLIFPNGRGRQWTRGTFAKMFRRYADLAGVRKDVSAYCLRHGFTVMGLDNGVGNRQIADVLGHASTRYVDYYGKGTKQKAAYLRKVVGQVHGSRRGKGGKCTDRS